MEELSHLVELVQDRPGVTAVELRDALRRRGRSSITTADIERTLSSAVSTFWPDVGEPRRWWPAAPTGSEPGASSGASSMDRPPLPPATNRIPPLYAWQHQALDAWRAAGHRGVIEAVTGTGKTVVGLVAAHEELARRGQVAIIVPTRELLGQWARLLGPTLPSGATMGLLGDSSREGLQRHDVVVAVVNSARIGEVHPRRPGGLLVADECHRYGSEQNSLVLHDGFARRMGLSATFARADDAHESVLRPYFGDVCYRFGYSAAREAGVIAPFDVALVLVDFTPDERATYTELTRQMVAARAELVARDLVPAEPITEFLRAVSVLARGEDAPGALARRYLGAMQDRRRLIDHASAKLAALVLLAPIVARADRTIIFTQSIQTAETAATVLRSNGVRAECLHSGLRQQDRRATMQMFRDGGIDALAAPQVLDEGVDVPEADLAVVLGASRSRRQMIQRMGRVLRRKADGRPARFIVVSVRDTIEDPRHGAHEAFLDEIIPVARTVRISALGDLGSRPWA